MESEMSTFDGNLKKLLTRAYEIPEYREEFRADLLAKLKDSQRLRALARQRRTVPRVFFLGTIAGMAAAAAVLLLVLPGIQLDPGRQARGTQPQTETGGTPAPTIAADANADADSTASPTPPAVGELARAAEWDGQPAEILPDLRTQTATVGDKEVKVHDVVFVRHDSDNNWQRVSQDGTFTLTPGTAFRTAPKAREAIGVWIDEGAKLVLRPDSQISNDQDGLKLEHGIALLSLDQAHAALRMRLPDYAVEAQPGSEVYLKVENGPEYAVGGEPAPVIIVLRGTATVHSAASGKEQQLLAGRVYELYDTLTGDIPCRSLYELERKQMKGHVIPASAIRVRPAP